MGGIVKAVVISQSGPPDVLRTEERPLPALRSGEVLIRVKAAGLNRADLIQRTDATLPHRMRPLTSPALRSRG